MIRMVKFSRCRHPEAFGLTLLIRKIVSKRGSRDATRAAKSLRRSVKLDTKIPY